MAMPITKGFFLHDAIVAVMFRERRFSLTNHELEALNEKYALKPQKDEGEWPDAAQMWLRAKDHLDLFEIEGDSRNCTIRLRKVGDAEPAPTVADEMKQLASAGTW
jgi:hypothetical protein